jgi:hypothetical protein
MVDRVLGDKAELVLTAVATATPPFFENSLSDLARELPERAARQAARVGAARTVRYLQGYLPRRLPELGEIDRSDLRRALIAKLAMTVSARLQRENLPESILALVPDRLDRLAEYLSRDTDRPYGPPGDDYLKDLLFVLLLSVPCGSNDLDLDSRVPFRSVIASVFRSGDLSTPFRYLSARGYGTWVRLHTDTRNLSEFNEAGLDQCYKRVAHLLLRREHVRGLARTSWFVDPNLQYISPHLAYIQRNPTRSGAFLLRHGTNPQDIDLATRTSKTRRRLYEAGTYVPVCHSLIWPRKSLLAWATEQGA